MRRLFAVLFVLSFPSGTVALHAQAVTTYDEFMKLDVTARREQFPELTPSNQAVLLREQVVRWRRVNAAQLTPEQDQVLADLAEFIRPELFGSSLHDDTIKTRFMALQQRASKAFTPQELNAFSPIDGPYLPPQP